MKIEWDKIPVHITITPENLDRGMVVMSRPSDMYAEFVPFDTIADKAEALLDEATDAWLKSSAMQIARSS